MVSNERFMNLINSDGGAKYPKDRADITVVKGKNRIYPFQIPPSLSWKSEGGLTKENKLLLTFLKQIDETN